MPQPESADLFRQPLAQRIDLRHPLAVLASRLPWAQIEAALAPHFARQVREGRAVAQTDLFGPSIQVAGAGVAAAGRPRLAEQLEQVTLLSEDTGVKPKQVIVDLGFRDVDADNPGVEIIHRGKFKRLTQPQRRWLRRRQAVEPAIGHIKHGSAFGAQRPFCAPARAAVHACRGVCNGHGCGENQGQITNPGFRVNFAGPTIERLPAVAPTGVPSPPASLRTPRRRGTVILKNRLTFK